MAYLTTDELNTYSIAGQRLTGVSIPQQMAVLEAVSRLADSYLRSRTTVPITTPDVDLKMQLAHIAAWRLLSLRGVNPADKGGEVMEKLHDDAIEWLQGASESDVTPGGVEVSSGTAGSRQYVVVARVDECNVTWIEAPTLRGW